MLRPDEPRSIPAQNVVLEASAGTGKTRVLVERYVNLLRAGIEPEHILAITFTRKAAAEMRQRIVTRLKEASRTSTLDAARWRDLRGRLGDIAISTIDAFCLGLLREFPLEAEVDPGFALADDTEVPRLVEEALDRALRICRGLAKDDDDVALVFAQLGERRLRTGLGGLLGRRLVAPGVLRRYLAGGPRDLTAVVACRSAAGRLAALFSNVPGGLPRFFEDGPFRHPQFAMLAMDVAELCQSAADPERFDTRAAQAAFRQLIDRLRGYFLTQEGKPRGERFAGTGFTAVDCDSTAAWKRHRAAAATLAPAILEAVHGFRRDLNVVLSRGVWRMFAVTVSQYQRTLDARALLDFSGVLEHAVDLLKQMDEFARSRYRLEARYHHVLVDEFQDTSRAQWELVEQLVRSWGEGLGASADALPPSIFIVGDRKQSIYGFRDAEVALLDEAAQFVGDLRGEQAARQAISVSFRSVPALLGFVNDVFDTVESKRPADGGPRYAFRYEEQDRFPRIDHAEPPSEVEPAIDDLPLGIVVGSTNRLTAEAVAGEVVRLIGHATIRDRSTGVRRLAEPADVAILFRSRESHREFESALEERGVPTYVYKGLGFFDADEIQDAMAVLRYLGEPTSNLRAAAYLRSRLVRLSDAGVTALAPNLAAAVIGDLGGGAATLGAEDRLVLSQTRASTARWLTLVDRITPAELLDAVLRESAYYLEIRGTTAASGAGEPEEAAGPDSEDPEPGICDARSDRRSPGTTRDRRRIERRHRRRRRGQPDDRSRGQGIGVPDCLRRDHEPGHGRGPRADSDRHVEQRDTGGCGRRLSIRSRRGDAEPRAGRNQTPRVRRTDARPRPPVPVGACSERHLPDGTRQSRRGAAGVARRVIRAGLRERTGAGDRDMEPGWRRNTSYASGVGCC